MKTTFFYAHLQRRSSPQLPERNANPVTRATAFTRGLTVASLLLLPSAQAQNAYFQHNIVSDLPGLADFTDPNLVNPWGIAFSGSSPFWVADQRTGLSTLYNGSGTPQSLVVTIPPPAGGSSPTKPTGIVFNSSTTFGGNHFIFDTEGGTI